MDKEEKIVQAEVLESNKKNEETVETKKDVKQIEKSKSTEPETKTEEIEQLKEQEKKDTQCKFQKVEVKDKKNKSIIAIILLVIILISIAMLSTGFALINSGNNTILNGISIRNKLVEGLTEEEATKMLNEQFESERNREISLKINGETYSITPDQIGVEYNVEKAVNEAYGIGRYGNIFKNNMEIVKTMLEKKNINVKFTYDEKLLNDVLENLNARVPNAMVDNGYYIEDNKLIITRGVSGLVIDKKDAEEKILKMIETGENSEVEIKTKYAECPEIDIDKIYSEVKTEPQDAQYQKNPFKVIPHKDGIDFDKEEAKKIILEKEQDEYTIKLKITKPKILTNQIGEEAFPDLLSSFSTKYDESNVSRSNNLKIAMKKLDGAVIMPGEVFSYNKRLGKRTVEEGYQNANGFAGGKVVPMLAGGICQISSTLYDAVLYANLNIVERHNHMFQATYVEPGKDATVVYGSLDFKFENTRTNPIMIKTKCGSGLAEIKIFGIKEEVEYDVEIITEVKNYIPYKVVYEDDTSLAPGVERVSQYGLQGCNSKTYRIVKLNGQEKSRELLSSDSYDPLSKIIRRGVNKKNPTVNTGTTPETSTPGTQEPETPTPEIPTPETQTPETPTPENPTPGTQKPETPTPENPTPGTQKPETPTPENPTPGTQEPDIPTPEDPTPSPEEV